MCSTQSGTLNQQYRTYSDPALQRNSIIEFSKNKSLGNNFLSKSIETIAHKIRTIEFSVTNDTISYESLANNDLLNKLLELEITKLENYDYDLIFKTPLKIYPKFEKEYGGYTVDYPMLGVEIYGSEYSELEKKIKDEIFFLWDAYAQENDESLTKDAIYLKKNLLNYITCTSK